MLTAKMEERRMTSQELLWQVHCLAAARDFSKRKMTLLGAAKHYGISYEDLYRIVVTKYQNETQFCEQRYTKALHDLTARLGSKVITLPLMDKIIMQTLEEVAEENNINVQLLWIRYNYERIVLNSYTINMDIALTLLLMAKAAHIEFINNGTCILKSLQVLAYEYFKQKCIPYPPGWDIHKKVSLFWLIGAQAKYRYEIIKNSPYRCSSTIAAKAVNIFEQSLLS